MPAFVKTPKDEKRWAKAKSAAEKSKGKGEQSFDDQDWALVNHIYHQAHKSDEFEKSAEQLQALLEKARMRLSDEAPDADEESENESEEPTYEAKHYDEYGPDEDEDAHQREAQAALGEDPELSEEEATPNEEVAAASTGKSKGDQPGEMAQPEEVVESKFPQPSKEEMAEMRQYTRPWEQRAREKSRLEAEAHKNPVLHHEGRLVEARNVAHKARQDAYAQLQTAPEYKDADPITQMEMDAKFHKDWMDKNPDYLHNAVKTHEKAHLHGLKAHGLHAGEKAESIKHVMEGGAKPEVPMSVEEGLQHAGGTKGEEGTEGAMISDPAASFAGANKDYLKEKGAEHEGKARARQQSHLATAANYAKKVGDIPEYNRVDIKQILGDHPALKDPKNKAKIDEFFQKYHPLIQMSARRVLNKLGLDAKSGSVDTGSMHEAGMHGLMQAINDYEHDNSAKASFATHAGNKIRGLMQTALRGQMQTPHELQVGAKKFAQSNQPKRDLNAIMSKHPPERADRLKRIGTFKKLATPKPEGGEQ